MEADQADQILQPEDIVNGLGLCAGIGGIELGIALATAGRFRPVCFVENDRFCQGVLERRFPGVPTWDDLKTFDGKPWRGCVDIVSAGFPCQPFSVAGKQKGREDARYLWPEIARIIGECRPAAVFLENVAERAYEEAVPDLEALDFECSPFRVATVAKMGGGHIRRRWFLLAHPSGNDIRQQPGRLGGARGAEAAQPEADSLGYGHVEGQLQPQGTEQAERGRPDDPAWWGAEPEVARVVHGISGRVAIEQALGNAVVPVVAAVAFLDLSERMTK